MYSDTFPDLDHYGRVLINVSLGYDAKDFAKNKKIIHSIWKFCFKSCNDGYSKAQTQIVELQLFPVSP